MATPNTTPSPPKASPPPPNVETQPTTTHHQRLPPKLATKPAEPALHQPSISSAPPSEQRSSNEPTRPIAPVVTPPRQTASTEAPAAPIITKPKPVNAQAFSVQVGIFANYDNAKTLVERLSANGVNAHIESRVQVGPFKNKAEADDTMRKLKAMGIQSVLVPLASSTAAQ
nr:SPOR domain-containing protein [Chitinivorax tropicus]